MIKSQLLVECIQDLLEVFDENETEVLESIKKACNEMLLRMHMGPGLHIFDPTDIYVVSRVPNTSKLSSPSSVSTLDDYCVETSFLITGIRDAEDIRIDPDDLTIRFRLAGKEHKIDYPHRITLIQ